MKNAVVIVAAGRGKRFSKCANTSKFALKQFLNISGKPMFLWSVETFISIKSFKQVIVVVPNNMIKYLSLKYKENISYIAGGHERFDSVKNGLALVDDDIKFVAIHDAARPLISRSDILSILKKAIETKAAIAVDKVKDTIKLFSKNGYILKTLNRSTLRNAQTPQIFETKLLKKAYAKKFSKNITDDSQLIEKLKIRVFGVETKFPNFKITNAQDFKLATAIISNK
ncbi:MAG: 2-C-methyl-D-erythritol 4-phosphate cytidylyltransferase [Endomicrobium sp.]|jgi:2-C-methyl-D-erythritol 4-phosphate cytidylyltransferase|nr:2-C-methyl-D-erythritol 4-phosphate cytidylyltransferase [Endomicrobium sp.]